MEQSKIIDTLETYQHLIGLSQSTYLDKVLKKFKMDQSKKGFLPVLQGVKLSKDSKPDHDRR